MARAYNNRFVIEGIEDFRNLPRELQAQIPRVLRDGAEAAAERVPAGVSGRDGPAPARRRRRLGRRRAIPRAPRSSCATTVIYAPAYEFGTQKFKQRAHPTFFPIVTMDGAPADVQSDHRRRRGRRLHHHGRGHLMPVTDVSGVDNAVFSTLASDAVLAPLIPDGVHWDLAPQGSTAFIVITSVPDTDHVLRLRRRRAASGSPMTSRP